MASHQQLLYHIVFSTKERRPLLQDSLLRDQVWTYMSGVCTNLEGHALRIGRTHRDIERIGTEHEIGGFVFSLVEV